MGKAKVTKKKPAPRKPAAKKTKKKTTAAKAKPAAKPAAKKTKKKAKTGLLGGMAAWIGDKVRGVVGKKTKKPKAKVKPAKTVTRPAGEETPASTDAPIVTLTNPLP